MSRYDVLKEFNARGHGIYLPYVMLGFPDQETSLAICKILIEEGVQGLELGFPFRDPVADGPVLQNAGTIALNNGFKLADGVDLVRKIRALSADIPLTGMCYYNMINVWGAEKFFREYSDAGLDGMLVPDLPPDYADELLPLARQHGLDLVFIASPNTSEDRMKLIQKKASGFVYVVTKFGITGVDSSYYNDLKSVFSSLHTHIDLPAIAGFGITDPAQARNIMGSGADGVITGSKIVELIQEDKKDHASHYPKVTEHTRQMLAALKPS